MKYHKNNKDDYKAMFMKGFLFAEELKDTEKAIALFEEFLTLYPEGDLSESAQYMLSSLKNKEDMIESIDFEDK
jgi:TolA-binding protein